MSFILEKEPNLVESKEIDAYLKRQATIRSKRMLLGIMTLEEMAWLEELNDKGIKNLEMTELSH